ncbi:MAG: redoxin family protein, partial [Gammaproteobacteria bacterium]
MGRYAIPLVVFLVVAAFLGIGLTLDPKEVPSPFVGKAAPSINLPDLRDGGKTVKTEDLKGRPWLLNVWATWCPECWREHGFLVRLAREKGITIVGLNWKDEPGKARDMLRKLGDPYAL